MIFKRWAVPILWLVCAAGRVAGQTDTTNSYRIGSAPWIGFSPLDVAEAKGFWRELGIAVTVNHYSGGAVAVEAQIARRTDIQVENIGVVVDLAMKGLPVVILAETEWSHGGDKIIVRPGFDWGAHRGRPIGTYFDSASTLYLLGLFLEPKGLRVADYRMVEMQPAELTAQFCQGRLAAMINYDPYTLPALAKEGGGVVAASSADFEGCLPEGWWAFRDRADAIPPAHLRALFLGWQKAVAWAADEANWSEYVKIVNERTLRLVSASSEQEVRQMRQLVRWHSPEALRRRNAPGGGLERYLEGLHRFLEQNAMLRRPWTPAGLMRTQAVQEARP